MTDRKKILIIGIIVTSTMLVITIGTLMFTAPSEAEWKCPSIASEDYQEASAPRDQETTYDLVALIDPEDPYVIDIADHMTSVQDVLDFVRSHIAYGKDIDIYGSAEYWARPVETLFHRTGDCEDSAILIASILLSMEYDPELIIIAVEPKGHVAVMVDGTYIDQFAVHDQPPINVDLVTSIIAINANFEHRIIDKMEIFI